MILVIPPPARGRLTPRCSAQENIGYVIKVIRFQIMNRCSVVQSICNVLKCSAVQHSVVQYRTVQYSTVQYSTVQYSAANAKLNRDHAGQEFKPGVVSTALSILEGKDLRFIIVYSIEWGRAV